MMKVLLFTHKVDIDGMGNAVLSKLVFQDLEIIFSEAYSITEDIMAFYQDKRIYDYDQIYITDLCPNLSFIEIINNDYLLKDKVKIFDHHVSNIDNIEKYPFLHVIIRNELGLCCGTSLFYQYLLDNNYIKAKANIDTFVELTRRHDTWEWSTIYHDEQPNNLSTLYSVYGNEAYINCMYEKLLTNDPFTFNNIEQQLIKNKKELTELVLKELSKNIYYQKINDYQVGIVFIAYEYRSLLAEYLRTSNYDMDVVMMIAVEHKTISYRSINKKGSALKLAEYFGGHGHENAAGSPITEETINKIIEVITNI